MINNELQELLDLKNDTEFMTTNGRNYEYCYSGTDIKLLLDHISELEEKIDDLENEVSSLESDNEDLDKEIDKLNEQLEEPCEEGIKNLENFIWRLKLDGVYTDKIQDFINNYMRFYNE